MLTARGKAKLPKVGSLVTVNSSLLTEPAKKFKVVAYLFEDGTYTCFVESLSDRQSLRLNAQNLRLIN